MKMVLLFIMILLSLAGLAFSDDSLESKLQGLSVPENELPKMASKEKLYAVQTRFTPLKGRHELSLAISKSFTAENFLVSHQASLNYRYFLSERWNLGVSASRVWNSLSDSAIKLIKSENIYPDITYAKSLADVTAGFNVFYAKFRFNADTVFYFDQYIALGAGMVDMDRGLRPAVVGDIGLAFWLGKQFTMRLGLKDYFQSEVHRSGTSMFHNMMAHLDAGILLGSGS